MLIFDLNALNSSVYELTTSIANGLSQQEMWIGMLFVHASRAWMCPFVVQRRADSFQALILGGPIEPHPLT